MHPTEAIEAPSVLASASNRKITLDDIKRPIEDDLRAFDGYFKSSMTSPHWLLTLVTKYVLRQKGKRIRPMLVLLAAKTCDETNPSSHRAAALVEMLHTASLVHDDVVDEADRRRDLFSINALWKNKVGVLLGDFLLSRGLLLSLTHKDYTQLHLLSDAVRRMSEGELLQLEKPRHLDIDEETYYQIISDKTASLISACLACGAASVTQDETVIEQMKKIGESLGMAFQIRDDLFDFGTDDVGKPIGIDLQEKKMTLPLIYALRAATAAERKKMLGIVRKKKKSEADVRTISHFVHTRGGIHYARTQMLRFAEDARLMLLEFPDTAARAAMLDLVQYTVLRKK